MGPIVRSTTSSGSLGALQVECDGGAATGQGCHQGMGGQGAARFAGHLLSSSEASEKAKNDSEYSGLRNTRCAYLVSREHVDEHERLTRGVEVKKPWMETWVQGLVSSSEHHAGQPVSSPFRRSSPPRDEPGLCATARFGGKRRPRACRRERITLYSGPCPLSNG